MEHERTSSSFRRQALILLLAFAIVLIPMCMGIFSKQAYAASKAKDTVSLDKTVYTMKKGKSVTLKATTSESAKKKKLVWSSSAPAVADVNSKGKVTAKKDGTSKISVNVKGTKSTATCSVTVGTPVSEVKVSNKKLSMKPNSKKKITCSVSPKNATNKKVKLSSSNTKVAKVSSKGVISSKKAGHATITATAADGAGAKGTCKVTVGTPVTKVSLNKTAVQLTEGEAFALKYTITPKKPTTKKVSIASSDKKVATVSSKGVITAIKEGKTTVTVKSADGDGKSASCLVTVLKKDIAVEQVKLDKTSIELQPGQTQKITATVTPSNATNKTLTWSSSNASVATVDNDGLVKAIAEGTSSITATSVNGISAACSISVVFKNIVNNMSDLQNALESKMVSNIVLDSQEKTTFVIPSGDYSDKSIEIRTPNADVVNNGAFQSVSIASIAADTYTENSNNVVKFSAPSGRIVVSKDASATINVQGNAGQNLTVENNGYIRDLALSTKSNLVVKGENSVPVTLTKSAKDSMITAHVELNVNASAPCDMVIMPGAETTRATVDDTSCIPTVRGVGNLPVTITASRDLMNIPAKMDKGLGIVKTVGVSGSVQEWGLDTVNASVVRSAAAGAHIFLLEYDNSNKNIKHDNYAGFASSATISSTDSYGQFDINDVRIGNYWMVVDQSGFRPVVKFLSITSVNSDFYSVGIINLLSDDFANLEPTNIGGSVINGITGDPLSGAAGINVKLRAGSGNLTGDVIATTSIDENGRYSFSNVSPGVYTVEVYDIRQQLDIESTRFTSVDCEIIVASGYLPTMEYNCVVNPRMEEVYGGKGQVQFTLTWGSEYSGASADIDSHLVGPVPNGTERFHIYYSNKTYNAGDVRMADLDVDDTDYEGPEHVTIYNLTDGIYSYYVHNFSDRDVFESDMLAKSSIKVTVTVGGSVVQTWNCPNAIGNLWYVCDFNSRTRTIIPKNIVTNFMIDESMVGASEEKLKEYYEEAAASSLNSLESDMACFNDNQAKQSYMSKIADWKVRIGSNPDFDELVAICNEITECRNSIMRGIPHPSVSDSSEIYDWDWDTYDEYEDEHAFVLICYLYGDDLPSDFELVSGESIVSCTRTAAPQGSSFVELIRVTLNNGLSYDARLYVEKQYAARRLMDTCNNTLALVASFVTTDEITHDLVLLNECKTQIAAVSDEDGYEELSSKISSVRYKYSDLCNIDEVHFTGNVEISDWWTRTVSSYNDGEVTFEGSRYILYIEYYEEDDKEIPAETVLSCISSVTFEWAEYYDEDEDDWVDYDFAYEIVDSNLPDYQKMIVASTVGKPYARNIYIVVQPW